MCRFDETKVVTHPLALVLVPPILNARKCAKGTSKSRLGAALFLLLAWRYTL